MSKLTTAVASAALLLAVALAGCGSDAAQEIKDGGLKKAACSAISSVKDDVSNLEDKSPEELDKLKSKVETAQKAIDGLGDNLPSDVATKVDDATTKLNDAIDSAQQDGSADKDKLKSASDDLTSALDSASEKLSC